MPSSTSNFDDAPARRAVWFLLLLAALVGLAVELGARFGVPLVNQNMRRFYHEVAHASALRSHADNQKISVLLLGNSLTYSDIDLPGFCEQLGTNCEVARWAVDDTNYLDWYFGLRRVFRAGSRPRFVVVGTTGNHLNSTRVRGNFFAHFILDQRDLWDAAARTHADATGFSALALSQVSAFYGSREEIYKRTMTWLLPRFEAFARKLSHRPAADRVVATVSSPATARLTELRDLCAAHGAQLIVWLAPTREEDPQAAEVRAAAREGGVPLLIPAAENQFPEKSFRDAIHLQTTAAPAFTSLLVTQLRPLIFADKTPPPSASP